MTESWPLRGRDVELARLDALVGAGRGVLLAGPPGVGKTRLAAEVADRLAVTGGNVARVVASRPSSSVPLAAFASLLPAGQALVDGGASALAMARTSFEAIGGKVLLVVDDVQWLDEASAVLIHQLVALGTITLLGSLRTGEHAPAPVTALWKDGLVERVDVEPLTDRDVRELLEASLGGPVDSGSTARHWERCGGNVLFLREIVSEAHRLDLVHQRDGLWCIDGTPTGSPRLLELVAERMGDLDDAERGVLEVLALAEPIGLAMLEELTDAAAVERLEADGVVTLTEDGHRLLVRPAHPLYGDVVRADLPELRRRRLLRLLADTLERHGARRREDVLRLALWRLEGGGTPTPGLLLEAAQQAVFAFDYLAGERLARAAWASDQSFEATRVLADALYERGRFVEREGLLADQWRRATTDEERALTGMARATGLFWGLGDEEAALQALRDAEATVDDPGWWTEIRATQATLVGQAGRHLESLALLDGIPHPILSDRAVAQAALARAFALPAVGRGEEALVFIDEANEVRSQLGAQRTLYQQGLLYAARAFALTSLGRLDEASELATVGLAVASAAGDRAAEGFFASVLGWVQIQQGQLVSAMRSYREAATGFRAVGHRGPLRWALGGLLFAAGVMRDREVAAEASLALDGLGEHPARMQDVPIARARAWAAVAAADPERARSILRAAVADGRARGALVDEAGALHDLARLGRAAEVAARLQELAAHAQGSYVRLLADHVTAMVDDDPSQLGEVSTRFEEHGYLLKAAEAAMGASDALARHGDPRAATRMARAATELSARCESNATTDLVTIEGAVPLTAREREIASLAADGLASRVIAERLFVSVRTVDNHLARIYTKLGVSGRAALASALGRT